jgi:hypothetical protein
MTPNEDQPPRGAHSSTTTPSTNISTRPELGQSPPSTIETQLAEDDGQLHRKDEDSVDAETSSEGSLEDDAAADDEDMGHAATRMTSTTSIAETLPLYRELLFVTVICLAQLFTRESRMRPFLSSSA